MGVRSLSDYNFADWRRLRPVLHGFKTLRYRLVSRRYLLLPPLRGDLPALTRRIFGRNILVTVAFDDPQVIDWQVRLVRRHVPSAMHIIVDNSRSEKAAAEIAGICAAVDRPYLRLPDNPWPQPSRSHGIALNWLWQNLIRPGMPRCFGFLDHDIFPMADDDPFERLAEQDCFGVVRPAGDRWFLWAGYCMFRFERVCDVALDFEQDWFHGLETGGGNWWPLYRYIARSSLKEAATVFRPYKPGLALEDGALQWVGSWLHEVGQMVRPELRAERREVVRAILTPHLQSAGERLQVLDVTTYWSARHDEIIPQ